MMETGMRVLLIEDDASTAKSIELMLKGFNVYTTDLGEEGVDLGKLYDYDNLISIYPTCLALRFCARCASPR